MKSITTASILALASSTIAFTVSVSKPFTLSLASDSKYNNSFLEPCREGAGFYALCPTTTSSPQTYNFNTSSDVYSGIQGILTYEVGENNGNISEPFTLLYYTNTNVALAWFAPNADNFQVVAFDSNNHLNIQSEYNDTVTPPKYNSAYRPYYNWYICEIDYEDYVYETLSWVVGEAQPQNPSCVKTDVVREF